MIDEGVVRQIVREVIRRRLGPPSASHRAPAAMLPDWPRVQTHASHACYVLARGADDEGPCLIEPAVSCTHCSFCQSHGH